MSRLNDEWWKLFEERFKAPTLKAREEICKRQGFTPWYVPITEPEPGQASRPLKFPKQRRRKSA